MPIDHSDSRGCQAVGSRGVPSLAAHRTMSALVFSMICCACLTAFDHAHAVGEPLPPPPAQVDQPSAARLVGPVRERARIGDESRFALPDGHQLRLLADGALWLDDTTQLAYGGESLRASFYEVFVGDIETTVFVGLQPTNLPGDSATVRALKFEPRTGRVVWHSLISTQMAIDEPPGTHHPWRVLDAGQRLVIVEPSRIVAIDANSGRHAWTFAALESAFMTSLRDHEAMQPFVKAEVHDAVIRDHELVVTARPAAGGAFETVELDLESGRRVWMQSRRQSAPVVALSDFRVEPAVVHTDDHPAPPPPISIEGHDLRVVGHALLVWNEQTALGIIVNPTESARDEILEQARALRVRDAEGRERPITWTAVIDTASLARAFEHGRLASSDRAPALRFSYSSGLGLRWTGAALDVDAVATALGSKAVRARSDLRDRDLGIDVARVEGVHPSVRVRFGKIDVVDDIGWPDAGPITPL